MTSFINRKSELKTLEAEYNKAGSSLVVIYGRRRVGKTTLIKEFLEKKPAVYFLADKQLETELIGRFKGLVAERLGSDDLKDVEFKTWDSIFDHWIRREDFSKKMVLIIDEFQYLAKVNSAFPSIFQRIWDEKLKGKNVMVILCGSLINMMYASTLSYNSPLYGRRTGQIKLETLKFAEFRKFFPHLDFDELVEFFSVIGGVPKYIETIDPKRSIFDNIRDCVLNKSGYLYSEPRFILSEEVSEVTTYFSILKTIAGGDHKMGAIAGKLFVSTQNLTGYFNVLIDLGIIERRVPITEDKPEKSKMGLYFIRDDFFRFWFKYVLANQDHLEMDNIGYVLKKIKSDFNEYVSVVFEDIVRDMFFTNEVQRDLPFEPEKCGRWWDKNTELDLVCLNEESNEILFGEAKWTNKPVGTNIYHELKQKSGMVEWGKKGRREYFALFSRKGFTPDMLKLAKAEGVYCFEKDELLTPSKDE